MEEELIQKNTAENTAELPAPPAGGKKPRSAERETRKKFYAFISPWLVGFVLLTLGPMIYSLYMSFCEWSGISGTGVWIGFGNYIEIFAEDPLFWKSLGVTFLWTAFLPIGMVLALFLAQLLNRSMRLIPLFRTIIYIPVILPAVANCLLWLWLFNPEVGFLNMILEAFGLPRSYWLMGEDTVMLSLVIMSLWQVGGNVVIFLAALQGVPKDLLEAAEIDGAGSIIRYFRITLPMISPVIFFQLVMGVVGALQVFNQAALMTDGGPQQATYFFVYYIYQEAFVSYNMGYASALAWVLFLIVLVLTVLMIRFVGRSVYYESD